MKYRLMLATLLSLGSAISTSAMAGEGNSEPFNNSQTVLSITRNRPSYASQAPTDVGSAQYPDASGRPGTALTQLDNDVLPSNGSEGAVQTANSLPRGAEEGTVAYAQARSVQKWMLAHNGGGHTHVAAR